MTTVNVTVVVGNARSVSAALAAVAAASTTIANLPAGTTATGAELVPVSQGGVTVKLALSAIAGALTGVAATGGTFTGDVVFDQGTAGVVRIKLISGTLTVGLYANATDTQPILTLGSFAGTPLLGFGAGGSSPPDTFWQRAGVGEMNLLGLRGAACVMTAPLSRQIVAVTTNRNFAITDLGKVVEVNQTALRTQTIQPVATIAWPVGVFLRVRMVGTGTVGIAAGAGVTIRDPDALGLTISTQYETRVLHHRASNDWVMTKGNGG
jgi:hypothetical protein